MKGHGAFSKRRRLPRQLANISRLGGANTISKEYPLEDTLSEAESFREM